jgi:hypothetical protein
LIEILVGQRKPWLLPDRKRWLTEHRNFKMPHWNYRIIRKYHEESDSSTYQIHEVYYNDDDIIEGWTQSPVEPIGESLAELRNDIQYFLKAFQKPVLTECIKNAKEVLDVDEEVSEINSGHFPELLDRSWVATDRSFRDNPPRRFDLLE